MRRHIYVADFETTTNPDDCRVWAWGYYNINTQKYKDGNSIDSFMKEISLRESTIYFHNAMFDCEFIFYWLFTHDYKYVTTDEKLGKKEFKTLITDMGQFLCAHICFENGNTVEFRDSLNIFLTAVKNLPKMFSLEENKLKIDYDEFRSQGHILTPHEKEYVKHDCVIVGKALSIMLSMGFNKLTNSSYAMSMFEEMTGKNTFKRMFPTIQDSKLLRQSYKGGYTYLKPEYKLKILDDGFVLDVNSLYPYVMRNKQLPYGQPLYGEGRYKENKKFPLYIQYMSCSFTLKKDHIPTIQIRNSGRYSDAEYLITSEDAEGNYIVDLCLTNIDLELLYEHYDVENEEFHFYYAFMGKKGIFKRYVDFWVEKKNEAKIIKNDGQYYLAKIMLNSLYGKFATNPIKQKQMPMLDENEIIRYTYSEPDEIRGYYLPIGAFITAWARNETIRAFQLNYDRVVYCDTDSLHFIGNELPKLNIDDAKLGYWKIENVFTKAKYIRSKVYLLKLPNEWKTRKFYFKNNEIKLLLWKRNNYKLRCAGLPESSRYDDNGDVKIRFNDLYVGATFPKLRKTHVRGGQVLQPTIFTIRM